MRKRGPNIWVVRHGSRFSLKEEGTTRHLVPAIPQYLAIKIGRLLAIANRSELIVQSHVGRIRFRDSHGFDSPQRKG